jgi:RNA polymerase sigma-70 factor (ECF subfamily)
MEQTLVVQARDGDEAALTHLLAMAEPRLRAVARAVLRDADAAEDATQQTLVGIWRGLAQLRDPVRFEAWTYRMVVNACHAEIRRAGSQVGAALPRRLTEAGTTDVAELVSDRDELQRGLRRLSVAQRAVIALHHYGGLTQEQVAEVLGVPVGTVYSRLHRAVDGLRAAVDADSRPSVVPPGTPVDTDQACEPPSVGIRAKGPEVVADVLRQFGGRRIVVDGSGTADAATLTSAVAMADDGDVVLVRPGTYRGGVVITKDVAIVGDGDRDAVVVEITKQNARSMIYGIGVQGTTNLATPYAFFLASPRAAVANLTIRGRCQGMALIVNGGAPLIRGLAMGFDVPWGGPGTGYHFVFMSDGARGARSPTA